jgi:uncharacterized protein YwqG
MGFFDWWRQRFKVQRQEDLPESRVRTAPRTMEEVVALAERKGLRERWKDLEKLARPTVYLEGEPCDPRTITREHSFLGGGVAFLRPGEEWPAADGRPLDPLARIRLSAAAVQDRSGLLPRSGVLTFWYDVEEQPWGLYPEDARYVRVTFARDDEAVERRERPGFEAGAGEFPALQRVSFVPGFTLPDKEELPEGVDFGEGDEYFDLLHAIRPADGHQMLGYADLIQSSMLEDQTATAGDEWVLLLQLGSDDGLDWMWGDSGTLYFWISRQDLAKCDFSKVWQRLQCF